jgi:energy-coupling factor transporter ATP-binding protein EcfA2
MKLTKLRIHRYRGITPGTELMFSPSLNLILGENGTGRTTLLELISIVLGSDFSGLGQEEFSLEYDLALPGMAIHVFARNERRSGAVVTPAPPARSALMALRGPEVVPEFEPFIEATLRPDSPGPRVVVRADASGLFCDVDERSAYARRMQWSVLDRSVWTLIFMVAQFIAPEDKDRLKELLHRTFLLGPSRFDEALGMFEHIGTIRYAMEMREGEVFPLGLMALPSWMPAWLRSRVERESPGHTLEFSHDELEGNFLARFVRLARFASGKLRVEVLENRTFENGGRLGFGSFSFRFRRQDGAEVPQAHLSYGEKRLLAFLYYLDVNGDFAVADELASGLHPRWAEACLAELGKRQAFLSSQNPLLFERLSFGSAADVRTSIIHCATGPRDEGHRLVWSQPTSETATRIFEALRADKPPSLTELLRAHGLW